MMHMWFWWDTNLCSFLFPGYDVLTVWGLFATCLGLLSLAVIYEAMKVLQIELHKKTVSSLRSRPFGNSENSSLLTQTDPKATGTSKAKWDQWSRWITEVLHWTVHTTLGYVLMLAVMTYNGYICVALVIGVTLGYWIFGTTLIRINLQQFHDARSRILRCDPECADVIGNEEGQSSTAPNVPDESDGEVSVDVHAQITT